MLGWSPFDAQVALVQRDFHFILLEARQFRIDVLEDDRVSGIAHLDCPDRGISNLSGLESGWHDVPLPQESNPVAMRISSYRQIVASEQHNSPESALSVTLPAGAKYVSGIEGADTSAGGNKLQWTLDSLTPGSQQEFVIQCNLGLPGLIPGIGS